jgi:hypothetical protein
VDQRDREHAGLALLERFASRSRSSMMCAMRDAALRTNPSCRTPSGPRLAAPSSPPYRDFARESPAETALQPARKKPPDLR